MYNVNTKKGGHTRIRNAARSLSYNSPVLNPQIYYAQMLIDTALKNPSKNQHFLGLGKVAKKITDWGLKKGVDKVEKDAKEKLGEEKGQEVVDNLKKEMKNPVFQAGVKKVNRGGTATLAVALAGGLGAIAAPALGIGGAAGGAGAAGAAGGAAGGAGAVGAGATVSAAEAIGAGTAALGAASQIKTKDTSDLKTTDMPDKSSIGDILGPIAGQGLKANGKVVEGSSNMDKIKQFARDVVGPATGKDYTKVLGDVAEKAAMDFLATLRNKKLNGEQLPPAYDKIAGLMLNAENTAENKIRAKAEGNIGAFVTENWWIILLALGLLYLAARSGGRNRK